MALAKSGHLLATCLGEEAVITDLRTGALLARVEADGEVLTALAITPNASHLILCSRSLSMQIHTLIISEDGESSVRASLLKTLKPHVTPVVTIEIDNTGTLVATGSADGVIKIWDIRRAYPTHTFRGHNGVISALHFFESVETEPDLPASGSGKKKTHHKSSKSQDDVIIDEETNGNSTTTSFRLASGGEDGQIRIWDLAKRKSIATLDSHVSVVRGLQFSPKANRIISASRDKTVMVWDVKSWKAVKVVPVLEVIEAVGFVRDGTFFYTGGENGKLRIWETQSGREITQEQLAGGEADGIVHILHNSNLNFILSIHADQSLIFHSIDPLSNPDTSKSSLEPLPVLRRISGTHDEIIDLTYVTPERALLALATNSESLRLVSLSTAANNVSSNTASYFGADVALLEGHEDIIICLDVDWSGCWLATGAKDNTARLWRIDHAQNSFQHFATFTGHAESIGAIALPDNPPPLGSAAYSNPLGHAPSFLLTGSQDRTVKKWEIAKAHSSNVDMTTPRAIFTRKAHDKDINAISVNHNSNVFASASQDRTVKIWSVEEGEVQGVLRGHRRGVWSVRFAPKDTPPLIGDNGPASTSRGLILTSSGDKTVKIWSLTDYSCLRTLEGHTNSVLKALWMPLHSATAIASAPPSSTKNTLQIASAGGDGLVKIWNANTGEIAATLDNHTDRIWALTVNPSTNTLVSGGGDSIVTFWKDTTSATVAASAADSTARVEQEQQLQNHIHRGNYRDAITLALQLNHPARLLALLQGVVDRQPPEPGSLSGVRAVDEVLASLSDTQLLLLMSRVRDWNTNARTAVVAQRVLAVVVRSYSAERLAGIKGRGWKDVLAALAAYTERHYNRMESLVDESYVVDFTLREMEATGFVGDGEGMEVS